MHYIITFLNVISTVTGFTAVAVKVEKCSMMVKFETDLEMCIVVHNLNSQLLVLLINHNVYLFNEPIFTIHCMFKITAHTVC